MTARALPAPRPTCWAATRCNKRRSSTVSIGAYANGDNGSGQTIGIYELGTYDPSDVSIYYSCYGITTVPSTVNVDGGSVGGFSDEATMDVEQTSGLAPGANIEVYDGPNSSSRSDRHLHADGRRRHRPIITTSWGDCEVDPSNDPSAEEPIFEQMAAQGQTMVASAGDEGILGLQRHHQSNAPAVDDPACQPYVTGVGGLTVSNITGPVESVWNDGTNSGGGASGGGESQVWSRPPGRSGPGITRANTMRMVPDLSVMGDPNTGFVEYFTGHRRAFCHHSCSGGWDTIGGTSISSQLVGALDRGLGPVVRCDAWASSIRSSTPWARRGWASRRHTGQQRPLRRERLQRRHGLRHGVRPGQSRRQFHLTGICPPKIDVAKGSFIASSTQHRRSVLRQRRSR